jgi:two-component system sensor histidine kinase GlrK
MDSHTGKTAEAVVPQGKPLSLGMRRVRLSIFWRLALGSLAIIVLIAGVDLYALVQLRQLTALSTELVSYHTPAIETAKRLITSLYTQLRSEKKFLAVHDPVFLKDFREEAEEFRRMLAVLYDRETSPEGRRLLEELEQLHETYRIRFAGEAAERARAHAGAAAESAGDDLIARMIDQAEIYIDLHEARVNAVLSESRDRSGRAETITQQLVVVAVLVGLGLAGIASYSILWPLRRVQDHIRQIGQGQFGTTVDVDAPSDLRELVDTVNWMGKKLQELDDMKTEFLAHISHELRTPLASIREGTQLLLDEIPGTVSQPQRQTLQIMKESSHRLIHLISTLLDLSKMEAGLMEYRIVPNDLVRVVESSVNKLRLLAEGKRVQIVTDVPQNLPAVPMDAARLEQVLDNLLSNALKFSPELTVVTVRVEPDQKGGWMRLSVSDMGPGIPADDLPHIFERFYQGRVQALNTFAGTGLGLALAKRVVEAHGGQIWVESEVGKGTTVRFSLPLRKGKGP